jgi:hypothetical protein
MKTAVIALLLAALPAAAQMAASPVAPSAQMPAKPPAFTAVAPAPDQYRFSLDTIRGLERTLDAKLGSIRPEPINLMGATRGLYLPGYGLVFTAELDLVQTPTAGGLFRREIKPTDVTSVHTRKLAQLPVLEQLLRDMVTAAAQKANPMPDNEHVVVAVRLWYQAFEDQTGLPSQIRMSADRKSAISGQIAEVTSK